MPAPFELVDNNNALLGSTSNPLFVTTTGSGGTLTANQGSPNGGGANAWPVTPASYATAAPQYTAASASALQTDGQGTLLSTKGGRSSALSVTAATVVKSSSGRLARISVIVAGTAAGSANDTATTATAAAANQIFVIPNTVGIFELDWPCLAGIVVTPGTGQTVAVSFT